MRAVIVFHMGEPKRGFGIVHQFFNQGPVNVANIDPKQFRIEVRSSDPSTIAITGDGRGENNFMEILKPGGPVAIAAQMFAIDQPDFPIAAGGFLAFVLPPNETETNYADLVFAVAPPNVVDPLDTNLVMP